MTDRKIRVLHFSSRHEDCGVARYLGHHIKGMEEVPHIENDYFDVSPYETHNMSESNLTTMADDLCKKLKGYDVLHIQLEFALYGHDSFRRIVEAGKRSHRKIIISVHSSPSLHGASAKPRPKGIGPRGIIVYLRKLRHHRHFLHNYMEPIKMADAVLAHNGPTIDSLKRLGVNGNRVYKVPHPVPKVHDSPAPPEIAANLRKSKDDIIYCTTGFIHRHKGVVESIKALKFLPDNYKLAVLGGMKADSDDNAFYDKVTDLIDTLGLRDRVYIAGFIPGSDDALSAYMRECDICVFPYNPVYYGSTSSGPMNLAFANGLPVVAYPTAAIKELAKSADGAVVLCDSYSYYELAREIKRVDRAKQSKLSKAYAEKMAWPKVSKQLVEIYEKVATR